MAYDKKFWEEIKEEFGNEFGDATDKEDKRFLIHLYLDEAKISKDNDEYDAIEEEAMKFKPYPGALCIQMWDSEESDWENYLQFIPYEIISKVNIFK